MIGTYKLNELYNCLNTDRQYIGFELDETYHKLSLERIKNHEQQLSLI